MLPSYQSLALLQIFAPSYTCQPSITNHNKNLGQQIMQKYGVVYYVILHLQTTSVSLANDANLTLPALIDIMIWLFCRTNDDIQFWR